MNKDTTKKNVHARVRLLPTACRLDRNGLELPPIEDEWIVRDVTDEGVDISNPRNGHLRMLGYDQYRSSLNPASFHLLSCGADYLDKLRSSDAVETAAFVSIRV